MGGRTRSAGAEKRRSRTHGEPQDQPTILSFRSMIYPTSSRRRLMLDEKNGQCMTSTNEQNDKKRRQVERDDAVAAISMALSKLDNSGRQPDLWERQALAEAETSAVFRGAYVLGLASAGLAAVEPDKRSSSSPLDPAFDRFDLTVLSRAFEEARNEPTLPHAILGPILVGRG